MQDLLGASFLHLGIIEYKLVHASWHQVHICAGIKPGSQIKVSSVIGLQSVCQVSIQMCWSWTVLFFILLAFDLDLQENESSLVLSSSEWSILFIFASWQLCALVSEEIDLHSLWVPCYLLYMMCSGFGAL